MNKDFLCPVCRCAPLITDYCPSCSRIEGAALLVHEAVHVWQLHAAHIGAFNDHGNEEEAYAIQSIAQALMESYARQTT